jgi:hypothetical protein
VTVGGRAGARREGAWTRVRRWGARELLIGWAVYWVGLLIVVFWPQIRAYYALVTGPSGHGSISWSYSGSLLEAALWIAGPPLLMAIAWIVTRPPRR